MISDSTNALLLSGAAPLHSSVQGVGETTSERARWKEISDEQHLLMQQQREIARLQSVVNEQRCEIDREVALRVCLQKAYDEQSLLVQQQQEMLAEVDRLYKEQAQTAVTDAITGLPNHRALMSRLEEELAHCWRAERSCAILFIDIDHFKRVNDTWGHRAGDAILREVGARLCLAQKVRKRARSAVSVGQSNRHYGHYTCPPNFLCNAHSIARKEDFVGRYGGEEFAIILTNTGLSGARVVAERLRVAIAKQPCFWQAEAGQPTVPISMTVSIGVAVYHLHGVTREGLVESADRAMYRAKQSGRNCVRIA